MARKKIIAGNWKMNGRLASNQALLNALVASPVTASRHVEIVVCVPFPYLAQTQHTLKNSTLMWGAQNLSAECDGAFTGEVAAEMLREFGCTYVIVGHSERRALYGESDQHVAQKFVRAQQAGLIPILCVGETLAQRDATLTEAVITAQLDAVLAQTDVTAFANAVIAYEPVWAIGTGKTATPQQAQDIHAFIRDHLAAQKHTEATAIAAQVRIQYGGSMKPSNAQALLAMPDIDGGLIGGASLVADDFLSIVQAGL